jgi:iron complex outermembrane recepter protein
MSAQLALGDGFFDDVTRGYTQKAAYTSVDFDLVPKRLTLTAGTRYFSTNTCEVGSDVGNSGSSAGCQLIFNPGAPNPCLNHSFFVNLNAADLNRTFSGFKSRANLSWKVTEDALLYYTWSQGFRAGGFNRGQGRTVQGSSPLSPGLNPWQAQANAHGGYEPPVDFAPDTLTNNELGWKTTWMGRRIQWDGAVYQENWDHVQIGAFDSGLFGPGINAINGGNYRVRGVETSTVARVTTGLTIEAAAAWNHTELVKQATFLWADGTPIDFSALQTSTGQKLANPGGALGSTLAGAPPFQGNIRARVESGTHKLSNLDLLSLSAAAPRGVAERYPSSAPLLTSLFPLDSLIVKPELRSLRAVSSPFNLEFSYSGVRQNRS